MTDVVIQGRNDLDLPDWLTVRIDEDGAVTLEFDGVLKEFHLRPDQTVRLLDALEDARAAVGV
jgi:hypothetical protein